MNVDAVCDFLSEKGFDYEIVQRFREEEMDGIALSAAFASCPGPECLKDVVSKCGPRLKVYNVLKTFMEEMPVSSDVSSTPSPSSSQQLSVGSSSSRKSSKSGNADKSQVLDACMSTPKRIVKHKSLPQASLSSFELPPFRQETEKNLAKEKLVDTDRKYIVQTLATVLMTRYVSKPSLNCCLTVARVMIENYKFLKDIDDDAEHAWKWYIYNRCQNVNRKQKNFDDSEPCSSKKYQKLEDKRQHSYPPIPCESDDDMSRKRNMDLLKSELSKPRERQRSEILKTLMHRTFSERRKQILEAQSVISILEYFPLLKKTAFAILEFSLVTQNPGLREQFDELLLKWLQAVVMYSKETQTRNSAIVSLVSKYSPTMEPGKIVFLGLQCLFMLLVTSKEDKRLESDGSIPYVINIVPRGTPPKQASDVLNNQPHVVIFKDFDDEEDVVTQHFISVEQILLMENSNIFTSIYLLVAAHYIFNCKYHGKVQYVLTFLQEKVFSLPSSSVRRTPTFTTHASGIARYYKMKQRSPSPTPVVEVTDEEDYDDQRSLDEYSCLQDN